MNGGSFPCERCGQPVPAGAAFCINCGAPVAQRVQLPPPRPMPQRASSNTMPYTPATPGVRFCAYLIYGIANSLFLTFLFPGFAAMIHFGVPFSMTYFFDILRTLADGMANDPGSAVEALFTWKFFLGFLTYWMAFTALYGVLILAIKGATGKNWGTMLLGLRLVREGTTEAPGFGKAVLHGLLWELSGFLLGIPALIGVIQICRDKQTHRAWWDKGAKLIMIRDPKPEAAPAAPVAMTPPRPVAPPPPPPQPAPTPAVTSSFAPPPPIAAVPLNASPIPPVASPTAPPAPPTASPSTPLAPVTPPVPAAPFSPPAPPAPWAATPPEESGEDTSIRPFGELNQPGRFRLSFDTGEVIVTDSAGLVGRNPVASGSFSQVVRIDDPDRSVSKTHLQFVVRDGQLFVMDRGSTNGTALQHPGGPKTKLDAGVEVQVAAGDTVFFGDRSFAVQEA